MDQTTTPQKSAVELVSKYFGQKTADIYNHFFDGESEDSISASLNELMIEYLGEQKAKEEINKYMGQGAL
jgi:hypothetical protein